MRASELAKIEEERRANAPTLPQDAPEERRGWGNVTAEVRAEFRRLGAAVDMEDVRRPVRRPRRTR